MYFIDLRTSTLFIDLILVKHCVLGHRFIVYGWLTIVSTLFDNFSYMETSQLQLVKCIKVGPMISVRFFWEVGYFYHITPTVTRNICLLGDSQYPYHLHMLQFDDGSVTTSCKELVCWDQYLNLTGSVT